MGCQGMKRRKKIIRNINFDDVSICQNIDESIEMDLLNKIEKLS